MTEFIQVMTTLATEAEARRLAGLLVEARLAACVQIIGPLTAVYRWQGKVETAAEYQLLIKSRQALYEQLAARIKAEHPYQVPEILAVPVVAGGADYLQWLAGELQDGDRQE